jgi:predicted enzyme related to lactoylglutathione lyase
VTGFNSQHNRAVWFDGRIRDAVAQVERHGGKVMQAVHTIGPHGCRAIVLDSEGNRIALHSTRDA